MSDQNTVKRAAVFAGAAIIVAAALASFAFSTTFIGDDHLFLTFARLVPNPLVAFASDQHGGEFYRPLPMTLWWLLARAGAGAHWPFVLAAAGLHLLASAEVAVLATVAGEKKATAAIAGLLFFLAPQNLDAAYWFSASTDLLATTATLGALIVLTRSPRGVGVVVLSAVLAAVAYVCKESALALPLLAVLVVRRGDVTGPRHPSVRGVPRLAISVLVGLAALFVVMRWRILGGWGGTGDARAPISGKALQLLAGLIHVGTGGGALPEPLAWGFGCVALAFLLRNALVGIRTGGDRTAGLALAFTGVALLPLLGAEWAVGSRYFYLPAVGLVWLGARCLLDAPFPARLLVWGTLVACSFLQAQQRHRDVVAYDARVDAARRAVLDGVRGGHQVFYVASGVKDLDLAVKETLEPGGQPAQFLVLTDVPASFVLMPPVLAAQGTFLLASPPLPPSGAYRFAGRAVVGLARRGDDPLLDDVIQHFPGLQSIRLSPPPPAKALSAP
jgi:hypothetical protein